MHYCIYDFVIHTAGHYIPAAAQVILESNSIYDKNLKGIGIGNGWVDPYVQYNAYAKVYYDVLYTCIEKECILYN